jgi:glycerophosphoryl diester phosphodiesterase
MYLTVEWDDFNTVRDPAWTAGHNIQQFKGSVPHMVRASAGAADGIIWAPNFKNLTPELTKTAQSLGLKVIPWTVNEKPQMQRMLGFGVDGIISDYPDRLREAMAVKGMPLPKGVQR